MADPFDIQMKLAGTLGLDEGGEDAVKELFAIPVVASHASAENATTNVADTKIWANPFSYPVRIDAAFYNPTGGGLTADNTNFATLNVLVDDGENGTPAIGMSAVTTLNTSVTGATGNWTEDVNVEFAVSNASNLGVPVGGCIFFNIVKSGAGGVDVPAGLLLLRLQRL